MPSPLRHHLQAGKRFHDVPSLDQGHCLRLDAWDTCPNCNPLPDLFSVKDTCREDLAQGFTCMHMGSLELTCACRRNLQQGRSLQRFYSCCAHLSRLCGRACAVHRSQECIQC